MFTIEANDPETPLTHDEALGELRTMRTRTPRFVQLRRKEAQSLIRVAKIPARFRAAALGAIGDSKELASAVHTSQAELRAQQEEIEGWKSVLTEIDTLRSGIAAAIDLREHDLGLTALQTYAIAKQYVRKGTFANLLPHVEAMRRELRNSRRRAAADAAPVPVPVPVSVPVSPK